MMDEDVGGGMTGWVDNRWKLCREYTHMRSPSEDIMSEVPPSLRSYQKGRRLFFTVADPSQPVKYPSPPRSSPFSHCRCNPRISKDQGPIFPTSNLLCISHIRLLFLLENFRVSCLIREILSLHMTCVRRGWHQRIFSCPPQEVLLYLV